MYSIILGKNMPEIVISKFYSHTYVPLFLPLHCAAEHKGAFWELVDAMLNFHSEIVPWSCGWRDVHGAEEECAKADSTLRSSQAVPHPSTNRALRRLTSEVERDPVHSTRYGRQRECMTQSPQCISARASVHGRCHTCTQTECNRMGWSATKWNRRRCSQKGWSCAPSTQQRSLHCILA